MPPRSRRVMGHRSSLRRKLIWATASGSDATIANDNYNYDLLGNLRVAGASVLGATVIRTHMRVSVSWPANFAPDVGVALGLCVQSLSLVSPPQVDLFQDEDWALRDLFLPGTGVNAIFTAGALGTYTEGFRVDLKAKRKVQELNQTWVLAYSPQGFGTDTAPVVSWYARSLIALP